MLHLPQSPSPAAPRGPSRHRRSHLALGLALGLAWTCACGHSDAAAISRRIDGEWQAGPRVPAAAYAHYIEGERALRAGEADLAVTHLEQALLALDTPTAALLTRLAAAQLARGERAAAEQLWQEAETLDPCCEELWWARASSWQAEGASARALRGYLRAARCAPHRERGARALASLLEAQGAGTRAFAVLRAQAEQRGNGRTTRMLVELALRNQQLAQLRTALALMGQSGPLDPGQLERWQNMARSQDGAMLESTLATLRAAATGKPRRGPPEMQPTLPGDTPRARPAREARTDAPHTTD